MPSGREQGRKAGTNNRHVLMGRVKGTRRDGCWGWWTLLAGGQAKRVKVLSELVQVCMYEIQFGKVVREGW